MLRGGGSRFFILYGCTLYSIARALMNAHLRNRTFFCFSISFWCNQMLKRDQITNIIKNFSQVSCICIHNIYVLLSRFADLYPGQVGSGCFGRIRIQFSTNVLIRNWSEHQDPYENKLFSHMYYQNYT